MSANNKFNEVKMYDARLTVEDIDMQECYRNLSLEEKKELISLIYEISLALYNSYMNSDE